MDQVFNFVRKLFSSLYSEKKSEHINIYIFLVIYYFLKRVFNVNLSILGILKIISFLFSLECLM